MTRSCCAWLLIHDVSKERRSINANVPQRSSASGESVSVADNPASSPALIHPGLSQQAFASLSSAGRAARLQGPRWCLWPRRSHATSCFNTPFASRTRAKRKGRGGRCVKETTGNANAVSGLNGIAEDFSGHYRRQRTGHVVKNLAVKHVAKGSEV